MKIEDQIKSPQWQKKRLEVLERDNFQCQICGSTEKTLHVHHLYYDNNLKYWEYPDKAYITLCEDCHKEEHRKGNVRGLLRDLNKDGVTNLEICSILCKLSDLIHNEHDDKSISNMLEASSVESEIFSEDLSFSDDEMWQFQAPDFIVARLALRRIKIDNRDGRKNS